MKKALMLASTASMIDQFNKSNIEILMELGYEVSVLANFKFGNSTSQERVNTFKQELIEKGIKVYDVEISREVLSTSNFSAYKEIKKIIENHQFDIIHCHTPIGAALTRMAARKARKHGTKVIYTAHGFHFFNGAPLKNWILYFPVEKILAKYTDCLVTINNEDYELASSKFKINSVEKINGIGIDLNKFKKQEKDIKSHLRKKYAIRIDDFILFFAAELNANKHQDLLINAVALVKNKIPNIKLLLAGQGSFLSKYEDLVNNLDIQENVEFLGYRTDINNLLMLSDLGVSSSRREGLPVNIMEVMAVGLPLIVTDSRGNRDLVADGENGYIVNKDDPTGFAEAILKLYSSLELRERFGDKSFEMVQEYSLSKIREEMKRIYMSMDVQKVEQLAKKY